MPNFANFILNNADRNALMEIFRISDILPVLACFCSNVSFLLLVTFISSMEVVLPIVAVILSTTTKDKGFISLLRQATLFSRVLKLSCRQTVAIFILHTNIRLNKLICCLSRTDNLKYALK